MLVEPNVYRMLVLMLIKSMTPYLVHVFVKQELILALLEIFVLFNADRMNMSMFLELLASQVVMD